MISILLIITASLFLFGGCTGKHTAPGQVQKETGYNYKSGKTKK